MAISRTALMGVVAASPRYRALAEQKAESIESEAIRVFNSQAVPGQQESEFSPPRYVESFVTEWDGVDLRLIADDEVAMWVEFGAHAGGKTAVLRYKPLTRSLEIVSNREGA